MAVPGSALIAVKAILMLLLFAATIQRFISAGILREWLLQLLFWICFILVWLLVGIINNDTADSMREAAAYFSFLLFIFCFIVGLQWMNRHLIVRVLLAGVFFYAALKFIVLLALIVGVLDPIEFYYLLKDIASGVVMSGFGEGDIPRITMSNDYVLPMILLLVLIEYVKKEISNLLFWCSFLTILILIATTLSRYLYLFSLLMLSTFILLNLLNRRMFKMGVFALFSMLVVLPMLLVQMGYAERLVSRFGGTDAASSDATKASQALPLIHLIDTSKAFGHGFGLSMKTAGRGEKTSFQAELQWLALTAKVGLVGLAIMLVALALYTVNLFVLISNYKIAIVLAVSWFLWLMAGFFNPVMLLTTTAINYLIFYLIALADKSENGKFHEAI